MKVVAKRPRGRPRSFDRDEALDHAVKTFWSKGYSGASVDDLTETMGINRPSLYGSFGDKHDLFLEAVDRYAVSFGRKPVDALLNEPDIRKAVAAYFETAIRCFTAKNMPRGCLIVNVAGEYAEGDPKLRSKLSRSYTEKIKAISEHFTAAQRSGQLPQDSDPEALARMIFSIMQSLAARARVGASRKELSNLAEEFLARLF